MKSMIRPAVSLFVLLTLVTGVVYPLAVTGALLPGSAARSASMRPLIASVSAGFSGLDPEISVAAAEYQVARVARVRHLSPEVVEGIVARHMRGRVLGVLGEPRVNVLDMNLELQRTNAS